MAKIGQTSSAMGPCRACEAKGCSVSGRPTDRHPASAARPPCRLDAQRAPWHWPCGAQRGALVAATAFAASGLRRGRSWGTPKTLRRAEVPPGGRQRNASPSDPRWEYMLQRLANPVLPAMAASYFLYPVVSLALAGQLDTVALEVLKGDTSQFMQNFFNFNGLLFSFFASTTYSCLYQQQEQLYLALYAEVSEARSLMEQLTLVSQGRPSYKALLNSMGDYVQELLLGVRLNCPPAVLLSAKPVSDPLENILYLTSVGVPSVVYDTVRSLRQARGVRLGITQRKLPMEHFVLLNVLGFLELLCFPLLGAGASTFESAATAALPGHVLWLQAVVFALLVGCVVLTLQVVQDLRSPSSGLYSLDAALVDMVDGLGKELKQRLKRAPVIRHLDAGLATIPGMQAANGGSRAGVPLLYSIRSQQQVAGEVGDDIDWSSMQPKAERKTVSKKIIAFLLIGLAAALVFPFVVELLRAGLSPGSLQSIREDNNAQWLQNLFTGISFIFSLFIAQTFGFLYGQQEQIYLALYSEVSEAKALLEQLTLVCKTRPAYGDLLRGLQEYVGEDLRRLDRRPAKLITAASSNDPLERVLYATSVGVPSFVYETVKGLRQARGQRLGATQQKLPRAHFILMVILGVLELSIFPVLSAGCAALDDGYALAPGHILFFHSILFGLMTSAVALTLIVLWDIWNPIGETYNISSVLEVMVLGLEEELTLRVGGPGQKEPAKIKQEAPKT